ncbi:MAG: tetratricopeptide repeat protein [Pyrinomonadaceae bacterium]
MQTHRSNILFRYGISASLFISAAITVYGQAARTITVMTEPKAVIWLNGVRYGTTDETGRLSIKQAPAGKQIVRVRANGFAESTQTLLPARKGIVAVRLTKTTDEAELALQEAELLSTVDRAKAIEAYRKTIRLKPTHIDAHIGLARTLSEAGDFQGAVDTIKKAVTLQPKNAEAAAVNGRILVLIGSEEKAIAAYKQAVVNGAGFQPEANTGLGILFQDRAERAGSEGDFEQESKNFDEAAKYFSVAVKQLGTSSDAPTIYQLLGVIYEKQKKYKEAIALYETFLKLFPESVEATAVRSFIVQLKKQMAEQ